MAVASAQEGDVIDVTEGIEGTAPNHGLHAPSFKIHFGLFQNWNTQSTIGLGVLRLRPKVRAEIIVRIIIFSSLTF